MQVKVTKEGQGQNVPKGSNVSVHYTGYLTNGKIFDSSVSRGQPFAFRLGGG